MRLHHFLNIVFLTHIRFRFQPSDLDMQLLFGNMEEVIVVSQQLLNKLEEATQGKEFEEQLIGQRSLLMNYSISALCFKMTSNTLVADYEFINY